MKKLRRIYNGWRNYLFKPIKLKRLSDSRLELCNVCPLRKRNKWIGWLYGYYCSYCLCNLKAKTYSPDEKCPIGKWT